MLGRLCCAAKCAMFLALLVGLLGCSSSVEEFFGDDGDDDEVAAPVEIPPRDNCTEHLGECLDTPLQSVPGGSPGTSRRKDCFDICRGQQRWPDELSGRRDCRWWTHK